MNLLEKENIKKAEVFNQKLINMKVDLDKKKDSKYYQNVNDKLIMMHIAVIDVFNYENFKHVELRINCLENMIKCID